MLNGKSYSETKCWLNFTSQIVTDVCLHVVLNCLRVSYLALE